MIDDDAWAAVIGQPDAVAALAVAARNPVHAYLLVGPRGSGKRAAARAFAGELLAEGLDAEAADRARRLAAEEVHPSLWVVERDGAWISAEQAREVVRRAALSPPEGSRQVIVLDEFHLVRDAAPILLKSIEEPPSSTVFVVLAEDVPEELVTIASRCVQIPLSAVPEPDVRRHLEAGGVDPETARFAAASSGGDLRRARLLAADPGLVARRTAWRSVRDELDGTGATVAQLSDRLLASIDEVLGPLNDQQAAEIAAFDDESERLDAPRKGDRGRLEARHRRETRRVRTDELRAGLVAMVEPYREALSDVADQPEVRRVATEQSFLQAATAVRDLTDSLRFNPNEGLALRGLLLRLPH